MPKEFSKTNNISMKLIYVKTDEVNIDSFLKFCFDKLSQCYKNVNDFNRYWKSEKKKYSVNFQNAEYVIINNRGEYIGCLEQIKDEIKSGLYIWTIEDIDLIKPYEEELFEFEKYNDIIDSYKFQINKVGLNKQGDWIYIEVENKYTHYRSFLINLKTFTNIKKYIRQEKIKNLLDNI
jgi:sporulation protein YlmC with PRC-barrel domain